MSFKQAIVVRTDLKMSKGKISAQVAHASLSVGVKLMRIKPDWFRIWTDTGQKKVILRCSGLKELNKIEKKAEKEGIIAQKITDAGHTQVEPGTVTVLAVGPGPEKTVDKITGDLKLL